MTATRKPPPVRKARRFSPGTLKDWSDSIAREYGLTPEAADLLAAINLCDPDDIASATIVITAINNAHAAGEDHGVAGDVIARRLALLRSTNTAVHLLRELARSSLHREGDLDAG
jgi:hypothetical protein